MKDLAIFFSAFFIFFLLSPGIFGKFPPKGDKFTVAIVHALVFSILFSFFYYLITTSKIEGLELDPPSEPTIPEGPYKDWCKNIRLDGSDLIAECTANKLTDNKDDNGDLIKKSVTNQYKIEGGIYCDKPVTFARNIDSIHGLCCGECPTVST